MSIRTCGGTPARMDPAAIGASRNPDKPAGALSFFARLAGGAGAIKELRRYFMHHVGTGRKQMAFMGHWRQGKPGL